VIRLQKHRVLRGAISCVLAAPVMLAGLPQAAVPSGLAGSVTAIVKEDLARHIEILASDAFEGREPGTEGERKTLDYLERAFRAAGAEPALGRSYRQRVPMVEVLRGGSMACVAHTPAGAVTLVPDSQFVALVGRPTDRADIARAPVAYVGYGIRAPEYGWDDYAGLDLRGGVAMFFRSEPGDSTDQRFFRGRDLTVHGVPSTKYELAARLGARAAIVVHTDATAGYPWSTLSGGGFGTKQMFLADKQDVPHLEAVVHMSEPAARALLGAAGLDFDDLVRRAGQRGFAGVATGIALDVRLATKSRAVTSHNVVARIRGREAPDECVVYTAHWDHVGRNTALAGDQIFNGAVDNATGTAALVELAQAYAALPERPRRSVYFVATTAEEKGLLGAEYYARNPLRPLAQTVAILNLDAHFPYGSYPAMTTPGLGLSELDEVMGRAAAALGRTLQPDGAPEAGAFYRNDTYPFVKRGVPSLFSVGNPSDQEPEDSPVHRALLDYVQNKYHKPGDEYDAATWDLTGVEEDVRVYFACGLELANDVRFPNWRFDTEFRRLRDAMREAGAAASRR